MSHPLRETSVTLVLALAVALAAAFIPGCYVDSDPPVAYADVTSAPVDVDTTAYITYDGRPTYYSGGRWWYRDGARWAYYRREPAELARRHGELRARPARAEVRGEVREEHHEERR